MLIPNEGKAQFLEIIFNPPAVERFSIELYKNNYTPVDASTVVNFTPADFAGAGPWDVAGGDWDAAGVTLDVGEIQLTTPPTWTHGGGAAQLVYGWFMYGQDTLICYAAQRFDVARNMTSGSTETLDPFKIKCKTFV